MPSVRHAETCGIYAIRRVATGDCYVGQSVNVPGRIKDHRKELRKGRHTARRMQHTFNKYGESAFEFVVLGLGIDPYDKEILTLAEQEWMDKLKPVYNVAPAAGSIAGIKFSEEVRAQASKAQKARFEKQEARDACSAAQRKRFEDPEERLKAGNGRRGKPSPNKGITRDPAWNAKQSEKMKGRPSKLKGRKQTQEFCEAISKRMKGRPSPNKGIVRKPESNAKQSEAMKALFQDPARREVYVKSAKNKPPASIETKAKIAESVRLSWIKRKQAKKEG